MAATTLRDRRRQALRSIVQNGSIRTQSELVEALRQEGFKATQATVSRDVADLDLQKDATGCYALAENLRMQALTPAIRTTQRCGNQVVIHTEPGAAPSVAAAIDALDMETVLGSIAGDDTILVIAADDAAGEGFQSGIDAMLAGKKTR